MGTEPLNYWFDSQLRRYAMQFTRIFQNFTFQTGRQLDGENEFRPIPVKYALTNRQVASIIQQNSENVMLTVPMISCHITDISIARDRTQAPHYIEKQQILERQWDEEQGMYTDEIGGRYQLDRLVPVPLNLTLKADVWTSNQMQKDQIFEQIMVLFNPSIDLQHSQNPFDWGALTIIELTDIQWSSRGAPVGLGEEIELMTLTFTAPIWLQPPSWLHPQKLIHQIVMNIGEANMMEYQGMGEGWDIDWSTTDLMARVITTPGNHQVRVVDDEITLLGADGSEIDENGETYSWEKLIDLYGKFRPNVSQLRLKTANTLDDESEDVIGTFIFHPQERNKLIWYVDGMTLPQNTLDPINGVLDPHRTYPGKGLPIPQPGHRYLLTDDIRNSDAWGSLDASKNDIIEWDPNHHSGPRWGVPFIAERQNDTEFLFNQRNRKQLKWTGAEWILSIEGEYYPGYWRLFL